MWLRLILVALGWQLSEARVVGPTLKQTGRCSSDHPYGMLGFDCRDLKLRNVPSTLDSNLQILDLTFNRIRELLNTSFTEYPYLQYLYLEDNSISYIEPGTFANLAYLEVIDLSWNSLHSVPDAIQGLPVLRKLSLGRNPFSTVIFHEPLPSVEYLSLDECKIREMPNLEAFPRLLSLNVSFNRLRNLTVPQLAPLCRLRDLDVRGNKNLFTKTGFCDCAVIVKWAALRGIKMQPHTDVICRGALRALATPVDNATCFSNETDTLFEESRLSIRNCEVEVLEYGSGPIRIKGSVLWTIGALATMVILIVCISSVYLVRRRQRHLPSSNHSDRSVERLTSKKGGS